MMRKARHVIELWQSLGLGRVPTRDRFKICNFPSLEPHIFATNVAPRLEDYRIALAGSAVEKSYGGALIGRSFRDLDLGPSRDAIFEEYEMCAAKGVAIASHHQMHLGEDGMVQLQRVLLPFATLLRNDGVTQIVGWMHVTPMPKRGTKGAVSRWVTQERALISASA